MSKEWSRIKLSDHIDILIGGTPSRVVTAFWAKKPNGHPWMSISDMKSKYATDTKEQISDLGVRGSNVKLIPTGSTIMSFKLSVGRTAITTKEMYSNEAIAAFLPKNNRINSAWLYHVLPRAVKTVVTDTAVKGVTLNKEKMAEMSVMLPCLTEQVKIAEILDNFDRIIQQTEAIIEKLKLVKQGMLHDLLTRGIGANGELRPPQSQAPHLYKNSPLGWIPIAWTTRAAKDVCETIIDCKNRTPPEAEAGHPVIRTPNVRDGRFVRNNLLFTDPGSYDIWTQRGKPLAGDVLITREAPFGEVCLLPTDIGPACLGQRMMMYRPIKYILSNEFMVIALSSMQVQKILIDLAGGSTVGHVRVGDIRNLPIQIPPLSEQSNIVGSLSALTQRLEAEEAMLEKVRKQKSGLMDDLLSGRVRVTQLLDTLDAYS